MYPNRPLRYTTRRPKSKCPSEWLWSGVLAAVLIVYLLSMRYAIREDDAPRRPDDGPRGPTYYSHRARAAAAGADHFVGWKAERRAKPREAAPAAEEWEDIEDYPGPQRKAKAPSRRSKGEHEGPHRKGGRARHDEKEAPEEEEYEGFPGRKGRGDEQREAARRKGPYPRQREEDEGGVRRDDDDEEDDYPDRYADPGGRAKSAQDEAWDDDYDDHPPYRGRPGGRPEEDDSQNRRLDDDELAAHNYRRPPHRAPPKAWDDDYDDHPPYRGRPGGRPEDEEDENRQLDDDELAAHNYRRPPHRAPPKTWDDGYDDHPPYRGRPGGRPEEDDSQNRRLDDDELAAHNYRRPPHRAPPKAWDDDYDDHPPYRGRPGGRPEDEEDENGRPDDDELAGHNYRRPPHRAPPSEADYEDREYPRRRSFPPELDDDDAPPVRGRPASGDVPGGTGAVPSWGHRNDEDEDEQLYHGHRIISKKAPAPRPAPHVYFEDRYEDEGPRVRGHRISVEEEDAAADRPPPPEPPASETFRRRRGYDHNDDDAAAAAATSANTDGGDAKAKAPDGDRKPPPPPHPRPQDSDRYAPKPPEGGRAPPPASGAKPPEPERHGAKPLDLPRPLPRLPDPKPLKAVLGSTPHREDREAETYYMTTGAQVPARLSRLAPSNATLASMLQYGEPFIVGDANQNWRAAQKWTCAYFADVYEEVYVEALVQGRKRRLTFEDLPRASADRPVQRWTFQPFVNTTDNVQKKFAKYFSLPYFLPSTPTNLDHFMVSSRLIFQNRTTRPAFYRYPTCSSQTLSQITGTAQVVLGLPAPSGAASHMTFTSLYTFTLKAGETVVFPPGMVYELSSPGPACAITLASYFLKPVASEYLDHFRGRLSRWHTLEQRCFITPPILRCKNVTSAPRNLITECKSVR